MEIDFFTLLFFLHCFCIDSGKSDNFQAIRQSAGKALDATCRDGLAQDSLASLHTVNSINLIP